MKAIQLSAYNRNVLRAILSLEVSEIPVPEPGPDEVLVKLHAASCNPSDIAFIQGGYNIVKTLPAVPGFEGSGTVVKTGKNAQELLDNKVSCFIQDDRIGTWAEYFTVKKTDVIVLEENMDMDQAACFTVNPFTAYALVDLAKQRKCRAIVQNAAGGQVPSLIRQLARLNQIETINIVRKKETAQKLSEEGVEHVLVEQDEQFFEKLTELSGKLEANVAFDAVAGQETGLLCNAMPNETVVIVYGGLSNKLMTDINPMDIIFRKKSITGFSLPDWKKEIGRAKFDLIAKALQQLILDKKLFTQIQDSVKFEEITQGLKTYLGNMSKGKILIRP